MRVASKPNQRSARVADQIRMEVADVLAGKCRDPRLRVVTVTGVEMNNDLRVARVYVSLLCHGGDVEEVMKILKHAAGFVRLELGRRLELRYTPDIQFWFDARAPHSEKIGRILDAVLPAGETSADQASAGDMSASETGLPLDAGDEGAT